MASGQVTKHVVGNQTLHIEKDGFEAILALTEFGNQKSWLLSGWEIGKPDAFSEVGTQSKATQFKPTFSRQELGAGLQNIISQNSQNFKPQNENSSKNSVSPEADAEYLAAVERGDMEAAQRMVEERIQSDPKLREVKNLHNFLVETSMYGIPAELSLEMANWDYRSKSPYSFSFYNMPGKSWTHTPEGILRVSDHWNFESRGEKHAVTDRPVENGTHWTLAEYRDGVYHVLKTIPRTGANTQKDTVEKFTLDKIQKEYPELKLPQNRRGGQDFVRHKKTGELLGVIANDTNGKRYSVNTLDGKQISVLKENAEILSVSELDAAGKYVYDTSAQKIKSADPVTYDDDGNVIPLSKRFNKRSDDVRFSVAPDEELELVRGNSNSESGMRDAELEILQAFPKHKSFQAKEILKSIADKDLKNIETGIDAKINTTQYNKMTSNAAVNKSLRNGFSRDDHFEALANIEVLYQNAVLLEHTEDLKNNDSNVKIYRFASPFVIKNDICDVLLTVKETISSNQRRVYTLELTEIKKLSERGSTKPNSQYYTDSLYKLHQKHEKIKRFLNKTSEKINGGERKGTDEYGDGVRSSLINLELTEDERSLVNIMKVLVSGQFDPDFDYAQRVKDVYGLEVSAEDAKFAAMVALREKKADAQRAAREKAYAYFRSNNPLFEFIDDFAGGFHDFHIVPVNGKGEKFTGTFIAPEYVRWSEKRPQGKNESDKRYQKYLHDREEALKRAKGYDSADLAGRACITICSGNSRVCDINFILTGSGIRRWSSLIVLFFRDAGTGEGAFSTAVFRDGNDARDLVRQIGNVADHAHQFPSAVEFG